MIASGLVTLVTQLAKGTVPSDVAGPVGIAQLTGRVVEIGPYAVLSFISLLSLNLALINILPIPALDGGKLVFLLIEKIKGKKVKNAVRFAGARLKTFFHKGIKRGCLALSVFVYD